MRYRSISLAVLGLLASPVHSALAAPSDTLGVPDQLARVLERSGAETPDLILIQDIHRHPEVQRNIAALILHLHNRTGATQVLMEGAPADEAIPPNLALRHELLRAVDDGQLSGPELAAALAPRSAVRLRGLEDMTLYRNHVEAYTQVVALRPQAERQMQTQGMLAKLFDLSTDPISAEDKPLLERLLSLRMTPPEREVLAARGPQRFAAALGEAVQWADRYYALADERSRVFASIGSHAVQKEPTILVVGGYHTPVMTEELRKLGRSYVVYSPRVTQGGFTRLYEQRLQATVDALKLLP